MTQHAARWTSRRDGSTAPLGNTTKLPVWTGLSPEKPVDRVDLGPGIKELPPDLHRNRTAGILGSRELAILLALDQYRYLDRNQVERLFFDARRTAQSTLRELLLRQMVLRWQRHEPGTSEPCASIYVLSARGAAHLSRACGIDPRPAMARARLAQSRAYHVLHDVESNGFFVGLAHASGAAAEEGLYHWVGEIGCRRAAGEDGSPSSDGWGRYLLPDRELLFDLEWDRGTEHEPRLRQKAMAYISHFRGRRGSRLRHVLVVAPTDRREAQIRLVLAAALPGAEECCRFWTTTVAFMQGEGALGRIWLEVGSAAAGLVAFQNMPGVARSSRRPEDCIAKPRWWDRRPGGGEGA